MGHLLERIEKKNARRDEKTNRLLNKAREMAEEANQEYKSKSRSTDRSIKRLGKLKIRAWTQTMQSFVDYMKPFSVFNLEEPGNTNRHYVGSGPSQEIAKVEISDDMMSMSDGIKLAATAVGATALSKMAVYGVKHFGKASTGTKIASLSGAAKENATAAWFGGGAKAKGGKGMEVGKQRLANAATVSVNTVGTFMSRRRSIDRYDEASDAYSETEEQVEKLNEVTAKMERIRLTVNGYSSFIKRIGRAFKPHLRELNRIGSQYSGNADGTVSVETLQLSDQKEIDISYRLARILYHVLSVPIIDERGELIVEADQVLRTEKKELRKVKREARKAKQKGG